MNEQMRVERLRRERNLLRHINRDMAWELSTLRAALEQALAELHHHLGCDAECDKQHPEIQRITAIAASVGWQSSRSRRSAKALARSRPTRGLWLRRLLYLRKSRAYEPASMV